MTGAEVIGGWTATAVGRSVGPGTLGICIVRGTAKVISGIVDWSAIGKVMDLSATSEMFALSSPQREIDVYTGGILERLTGLQAPHSRFRAARCYGLTEIPDGSINVLWIEDLSGEVDPP